MGRRKKITEQPQQSFDQIPPVSTVLTASAEAGANAGEAFAPAEPSIQSSIPVRLTVAISDSGEPLWESCREKTLSQWKQVLCHQKTLDLIGIGDEKKEQEKLALQGICNEVFSIIAKLSAFVVSKQTDIPSSKLLQFFILNDEEKRSILPLSSEVLNRHIPDTGKWAPEIALMLAVSSATFSRVQLVRQLVEKQQNVSIGKVDGQEKQNQEKSFQ